MYWGAPVATDNTCPNCGYKPYNKKDACDSCGFKKPNDNRLTDIHLIFCTECGCHYTCYDGACPTHGLNSATKPKLPI